MSTTSDNVLLVERAKLSSGLEIERWSLNRPSKLNALSGRVLERLGEEAERLGAELERNPKSCCGLLLTGSGGKNFAAGADISEMASFDTASAEKFSQLGSRAFSAIESLPLWTISCVEGFALGGGLELAMACDTMIVASDAKLGQPESLLALIPGFGGTTRFVERLGRGRAMRWLMTGAKMSGDEAFEWGLADDCVPSGQTLQRGENFLELASKGGPLVAGLLKQIIDSGVSRKEALQLESRLFGKNFASEDSLEGRKAFLEKRPARFQGQ